MRRVLFITQRLDRDDPVLAATVPMVAALARRVDEVAVLAQSARTEGLPANVTVSSFGAARRLGRAVRFEEGLAKALRERTDLVVAHMIPLYAILAAPLVRPRRIPLVLWYTHWKAHLPLRLAERVATAVVSVDSRSFPLRSDKVRAIGHGIDVSEFECLPRGQARALRLLVLGRYSPAKGLETILRGVESARAEGLEVELELHGAALAASEQEYRRSLERFGFALGDAVPRHELGRLFARADALVNNMQAGAPDKVVYEAAAACLPVLASNPVFDRLFAGFELGFERDSPESLAARLRAFAALDTEERAKIGRILRERVARHHSVDTWAEGVLAAARTP